MNINKFTQKSIEAVQNCVILPITRLPAWPSTWDWGKFGISL